MKEKERYILNLINKYSKNNIQESKYKYSRFDAYNKEAIFEIKYRNKFYNKTIIEFDKYSYNNAFADLKNKKFIYVVMMEKSIYIFNITDLVSKKYDFNFNWKLLPSTTEFKNSEDLFKFTGFVDIKECIKEIKL